MKLCDEQKLLNLDAINGTFAPCEMYSGRLVMKLLRQQETIVYPDGGIAWQELAVALSHFTTCCRCIYCTTESDGAKKCRNPYGLKGKLEAWEGCSRGKPDCSEIPHEFLF